ncbi:AMP-binding protein [Actinokineospora soli]|uniref:AMP-binding protein n=1 Tax=Actinokineospora soli TaxID=1048753 RepID=A0ABW2TRQ9_9PSEU
MSESLVAQLAGHAVVQPGVPAVVMGERRVDYAELTAMTAAAAARITALGLRTGDRVAVHAAKSPETVALMAACLRMRVPFLLPSVELGADTFSALLQRADCGDILAAGPVDAAVGQRIHEITGPAASAAQPPAEPGHPDDVSLLLTTSGSTGLPKIVPITAGAIDAFTTWAADHFGIRPGTAVLNYAPFNFDLCLLDVWTTLAAGGTVVLVEAHRSTNGKHIAGLVRQNRVEVVQAVPMLFRLLVDAWDGVPFADVRHVVLTGDKASAKLLAALPELFPNAAISNVYGCTETNDSFEYRVDPADVPDPLPIGTPLPGVDAVVVAEDGTVLTGPATGELHVRTPFQTPGYHGGGNDRFVALPGRDGVYFRSGDLVSRDADGVHTLLGRNDFQVKVRGTRINLEEIEHVLLAHDAVTEAAVVGVPDDLAGVRVHAVVRGAGLDSLALREHCRLRLPRVAIPRACRSSPSRCRGRRPARSTGSASASP